MLPTWRIICPSHFRIYKVYTAWRGGDGVEKEGLAEEKDRTFKTGVLESKGQRQWDGEGREAKYRTRRELGGGRITWTKRGKAALYYRIKIPFKSAVLKNYLVFFK